MVNDDALSGTCHASGPGPWRLFDSQNDPCQMTDASTSHPDVTTELADAVQQWSQTVAGDLCPA